jgi:hypothetical protein
MKNQIKRFQCETAAGNQISFFYNPENNLVVVDVSNETGGNEICRKTLDEKVLLAHLK